MFHQLHAHPFASGLQRYHDHAVLLDDDGEVIEAISLADAQAILDADDMALGIYVGEYED